MTEDTKQCAIFCFSIAAIAMTIAICTCWYNTATESAAIKSGMEQVYSEGHTIWAYPKSATKAVEK